MIFIKIMLQAYQGKCLKIL